MTERELPAAVEIEKKLLSAMLLKEGAIIPTVANLISDEDLYRQEHKMIFRALVALYNRGTPLDILLVEEELKRTDELARVNRTYLFSLAELEYSTARATSYAAVIREKSLLRKLMLAGREIASEAGDERKEVEEVLESAEKKILSVTSKNTQTGFERLNAILQSSFERIQHIHNNPGELDGVPTGLLDVDKILNGLHKADLILLAARPSMGKTALALNIAVNAAERNKTVALYSLEMSKTQLGNRLLSTKSGVNSLHLNTGNLSDNDMEALLDALEDLSRRKMFIDDTAGISLLELRSRARRLRHEHGLDLVIIDYLQLMQGQKTRGGEVNRQQEISEISRNLKGLARELDVPILALSQLSRNVEMRAEKKPQLSDLRESGSLEQDADIVMFLYRDEYYNRDDTDNQNIAELIIAKNRNGPTTSVRLQFQKEIMRFGNLTRAEG